MTYWQGPSPWGDGKTVEEGDPRKDSRVVATCESPEMADKVVRALNLYDALNQAEDAKVEALIRAEYPHFSELFDAACDELAKLEKQP